ncbi:MAG: hypothetical protein R3E79_08610 [Caldilineaceae bacterium]
MNQPNERNFTRGFLPPEDPLPRLPTAFDAWEAVAQALPKLNLSNCLRPTIESLPPFPVDQLHTTRERERAMTLLSFLGNSYVFAWDQAVATCLPAHLAVAWVAVAKRLGRPPMLTYASNALHNWRRIDPEGPVALGNLALIQNFLGGMDEEWFTLVHTNIEAAAGRGLAALLPAQAAVARDDATALAGDLAEITATLQTMHDLLARMPERCDPHIYYHRVRPFIFGWKDNPLLPQGMIYTGVPDWGDKPQQFRGETGAQSSVIYAFDATLGIDHEFDAMRAYLQEMRDYMPVQDRAFLTTLERGPAVRTYVAAQNGRKPWLRDAYNACIEKLQQFRQLHIEYAARYIIKPAQGAKQGEVGTGGTPFTVYLKKHIQETKSHLL